jgi:glycine/D-amino acid oxidase-like deaminating enzyme
MKPLTGPPTDIVAELPEECDVAVVGGGIAGVCVAYHLATAGVRTVVLERERLGSGATGSAVGVLSPPLRQPFDETVHFRGVEVAKAVWEFALRSVAGLGALIEARGGAEQAGLDLSGGYVLADVSSLHQVESAFKALHEARLPVEWLSGEQLRSVAKGRGFVGGYRIEGGGCLSPAPTVRIVAEAAQEAGARSCPFAGRA